MRDRDRGKFGLNRFHQHINRPYPNDLVVALLSRDHKAGGAAVRLALVRVCPALEQQARQLDIPGEGCPHQRRPPIQ